MPVKIKNILRDKKPPITIRTKALYANNLDYVSQQYKPMLDYLDTKSTPSTKSKGGILKSQSFSALDSLNEQFDNSEKYLQSLTKKQTKVKRSEQRLNMDYMDDQFSEISVKSALQSAKKVHRAKSAKAIEGQLLFEATKNLSENTGMDIKTFQRQQVINMHDTHAHAALMQSRAREIEKEITVPLEQLKHELKTFENKSTNYFLDKR